MWAEDLEKRLVDDERFEIIAPRPLALVCFRHVGGNDVTKSLAEKINASGTAYVTPSLIDETQFIRVSIGSTWTEQKHDDALWELIDLNGVPS